MMRALAHPARISILQYLVLEGPATATECAQVAELSPSACSYHLRTLARYGFVDEDPDSAADGRERPWRAKLFAITVERGPETPSALRAAGDLLSATVLASVDELRERYEDRKGAYPAAWQHALGYTQDAVHVTAEELVALQQRLLEVFGEYRRLDKAERPAGARRVLTLTEFLPWFPPDEEQP
jgi:predicted ArsR family transcriptional regulator